MPVPTLTTVFDAVIPSATPTYTNWFSDCQFLIFQSDTAGEYTQTGEFIEVAVALWMKAGPIIPIERIVDDFQDSINTIDLILLPEKYRNDCFPMRILINPSTSFHARIIAISC